jgi:predicted RNase H-like HicB family nuclease
MRYLIMIRRTPTGYSVDVPDLPGCVAAAKSLNGARRLIAEAIALHLELMRESGEPLPRQSIDFVIDPAVVEELCTWVDVRVPDCKSRLFPCDWIARRAST